nr:lipopolysaccharide-induced tumor necrosis factor-alpha factor homolog [Vanessa tameamea]
MKDPTVDSQPYVRPSQDPPPYPGLPDGPNYPGPPGPNYNDPRTGQSYPGYPISSQPQVTLVHPSSTTVYPAVVIANSMSPNPSPYVCRSCNQQIITRVERTPSLRTHLLALMLCILGCWPCVCLPYCVDTCNNAEHYCTNCNAYVGSYVG